MERFTLYVERGTWGLWYVTSPECKGLLVAETSLSAALECVSEAMLSLEQEANRSKLESAK